MGSCNCKETDSDINLTKDQNINLSKDPNSSSPNGIKTSPPQQDTTKPTPSENEDKNYTVLSDELFYEILAVFKKMDVDNSKEIDRNETIKYWKNNFAKLNTNELFRSVDADGNGAITQDEWVKFWVAVKKAGYSDAEVLEEVEGIHTGQAWVCFGRLNKDGVLV